MKKISCPHCGNTRGFREWTLVHCYNYFVQKEDGKVLMGENAARQIITEREKNGLKSKIFCKKRTRNGIKPLGEKKTISPTRLSSYL